MKDISVNHNLILPGNNNNNNSNNTNNTRMIEYDRILQDRIIRQNSGKAPYDIMARMVGKITNKASTAVTVMKTTINVSILIK